jgi:predicted transcriptional regulator
MTLLYLPRWMEVLIALERLPESKRYPQRLYRTCPACVSHTKTVLKQLQRYHLIRTDKKGHIRWINLTPQGRTLIQHLTQVRWTLASLYREQNSDGIPGFRHARAKVKHN